MFKAVIFDMDGVLVDSQPFHFNVDYMVLQKSGVDCDLTVTHNYAGMSNGNRWKKYKNDFKIQATVEELIAIHVETIMELLENSPLEVMDGIPLLLESLNLKGLRLAVASSSSYGFIYKMLDKLGIRDCFQYVLSGEDMENSKPAPDIFLKAAEVLGIPPFQCVVIEDSLSGVTAAKAAGMKCVGYVNPNSGNQDLSKADIITDDFNGLARDGSWLEKDSQQT